MTFKTQLKLVVTSLMLTALTGLTGCATTGMQRSENTGTTMQTVEREIQMAVAQIDVTAASLEALVRPGQSNIKKAFKRYSADVEKMDDLNKDLFKHVDKMSAQGKEYFEEWQTQGSNFSNPEIQTLSEQRRSEQSAVYARISEASVGVKGASKAYMSDIKEIQAYLSNDLTPKGVEAITPVSQKAVTDGESLKNAVEPVLTAIGSARAELAQGGTKK